MSYKAQVTGQFNLTDVDANLNVDTYTLPEAFGTISNITHRVENERTLITGDGVVTLPTGGLTAIQGIMLVVSGTGTVTFKHDGNVTGIDVSSGMLLFGNFTAPTIETTSVTALKVKYVLFGT